MTFFFGVKTGVGEFIPLMGTSAVTACFAFTINTNPVVQASEMRMNAFPVVASEAAINEYDVRSGVPSIHD